jgi:HEAT repeat protein
METTSTFTRNANLRSPITTVVGTEDLTRLGRAGARYRLEQMLGAVHGLPDADWRKLDGEERAVLRRIARETGRPHGEKTRAAALCALGIARDPAALPLLMQAAGDGGAPLRVRISAAGALAELGDEQALPVLLGLVRGGPPELRARAAYGLRTLGTAAELAHLDAVVEADTTFAGEAARDAASAVRARLGVL